MFENVSAIHLNVRPDGKIFQAVAAMLGNEEPDTRLVVGPGDPRFCGPDGKTLDPDGVYVHLEGESDDLYRLIDEKDREFEPVTITLVLHVSKGGQNEHGEAKGG